MKVLALLLVAAALLLGVYEFYLRRMPAADPGTAPTQAITLVAVRSDLLVIAQAERAQVALEGQCSSLEELASSGRLQMGRPGRDGYTYQVHCSGPDFEVLAEHPAAPQGSPIRYPKLAIGTSLEIRELP